MKNLTNKEILKLNDRFRANLINSLSGFKSANLIGTKNKKGQENLSIVSSVTHVGSNPPLLSVVFRPPVVERHSYENILETGSFTINHIDSRFFHKAHQTSARYPRDFSEFTECGLEKEYLKGFFAPFVKESRVKVALEFVEKYEILANKCVFIVGSIKEVYFEDVLALEDGSLDLPKAEVLSISGLDMYCECKKIAKLPYAKFVK